MHLRSHTGEFLCHHYLFIGVGCIDHCYKEKRTKCHLETHTRSHTGEFMCRHQLFIGVGCTYHCYKENRKYMKTIIQVQNYMLFIGWAYITSVCFRRETLHVQLVRPVLLHPGVPQGTHKVPHRGETLQVRGV